MREEKKRRVKVKEEEEEEEEERGGGGVEVYERWSYSVYIIYILVVLSSILYYNIIL